MIFQLGCGLMKRCWDFLCLVRCDSGWEHHGPLAMVCIINCFLTTVDSWAEFMSTPAKCHNNQHHINQSKIREALSNKTINPQTNQTQPTKPNQTTNQPTNQTQAIGRPPPPRPLPASAGRFMTGHSHELRADGQIFTDAELLAVAWACLLVVSFHWFVGFVKLYLNHA